MLCDAFRLQISICREQKISVILRDEFEFDGGNSNGTVLADYIYSDFNIANYFISDNHSKENKETLEDIVFDRTNSDAHIHRADDLL